ncbi:hypothetical protein A2160_01195 [Candidatus Beckwithbacteria bacterium RBG_13_42_9]|uniref:Uncharacterized protein n=1 Tax=Candidatus Beckwithbacteria bacterium RBG_13_42_9 TaxID=1797457 RepID=A0A1F5E3F7_9BACT|nr:MAG: hypothetical protein A2160_01195 [Candidatus Beckwithbacteria bacterium RBG_13_42_9]
MNNNKRKTPEEIINILKSGGYCYGFQPDREALTSYLAACKQKKRPIKLIYGETYDQFGITIDSLKYYFFLSLFHRCLENQGIEVESSVMVADRASVLNPLVRDKDELLGQAKKRVAFLNKIIHFYGLPIKPVLMSDFFRGKQLQNQLKEISSFAINSKEALDLLEKTVLKNRLKQEKQSGFRYGIEAMVTAMQFNIKIGPPREQFYDRASNIVAKEFKQEKLHSVYLRPTHPLGKDFLFFISHPEIEEYGLTPYKAGSNQLQNYRVILGKTTLDDLKQLIDNSFVANNLKLANPVFDLYFMAELAQKLLQKDFSFPSYKEDLFKNDVAFKEDTINKLRRYIFSQIGGLI